MANGDYLVTSSTTQAEIEVRRGPTKLPSLSQNTLFRMLLSGLTFSDNISIELGSDRAETVICAGIIELLFLEK